MSQETNRPVQVLVVEDERAIQRLIEVSLRKRGYEVLLANDGMEGLELAQKNAPDLIISDVMMPRMDGWTFIKQIRSLPQFAFVPVIFLTALNEPTNRIQGFQLGADDYMPKPIHPQELALRIENALRHRTRIQENAVTQSRAVTSPHGPGLQGDLHELGLPSLLALLEMERKSGTLELKTRDGAYSGLMVLRSGSIIRAHTSEADGPKNENAVYWFLRWPSGTFQFRASNPDEPAQMTVSTTHLLLEGARLSDEETRQIEDALGRFEAH